MAKPLLLVLVLVLFMSLAGCSAFSEPRDWDFVQSVGGIAFDRPSLESGEWVLPIQADVSGLQKITVAPTLLNSGLSCKAVEVSIEDKVIYLTLVTGLGGRGRTSICPAARLGVPAPGAYAVMYRAPRGKAVRLGEVLIGTGSARHAAASARPAALGINA